MKPAIKPDRPVNLDLTTFRFPPAAIASILHRVSGVILFLFIPLSLWMLQLSLASPEDFETVREYFDIFWVKLLIWAALSGLFYHLVAGIRHLFMDAGVGEEKCSGQWSGKLVIGVGIVLSILVGVWLW
jgi:succinate dehydrogenase / fumarate reductase, cytochrome b subunit